MPKVSQPAPIIVKRFDRSRLYDTTGRRYLSAKDLRIWERDGLGFVVIDADTGEDITPILLA